LVPYGLLKHVHIPEIPKTIERLRMSTICRLPSSVLASLRRIRSIAAGSTQSLKGAPLRKAPGLRASTGT
jgi:hypothetical protein